MPATAELPATTIPTGTVASAVPAAPVPPVAPAAAAAPAPVVPAAPASVPAPVAAAPAPAAAQPEARKSLLADAAAVPAAPEAVAANPPAAAASPEAAAPEPVYALKAPDKSSLTAADVTAIEAFAKERKISPEAAQALVERESQLVESVKTAQTAQARVEMDKLYDDWAAASAKDPIIGGPKWAETQQLAKRALNLDSDFKALIETSPFGNHPKVLAFLAKVGALTREDKPPVGGSTAPAAEKPLTHVMFPSSYAKPKA